MLGAARRHPTGSRRPPDGQSNDALRPHISYLAGAKYHADILEFQFHRSQCKAAGYDGPLHRCSIYDNKETGARLKRMLEIGASRPWPDALEALTGQRELDATAIIDYFAPLKTWLDEQNKGRVTEWK